MGRYGSYGDVKTCPVCGAKVSVLAYGRHKGSPACLTGRQVNEALDALRLNSFDKVFAYATLTIEGKQTRALAIGIDKMIDAVTVIHTDGNVRQYIRGEWGPTKAKNPGGVGDDRRQYGVGLWR